MDINMGQLKGAKPVGTSPHSPPPGAASSGVAGGDQGVKGIKDDNGVSVKLTDAASLLHASSESLRQSPAADPARVAQLRSAIASGRYHVDASRVAAKFMSLESNL